MDVSINHAIFAFFLLYFLYKNNQIYQDFTDLIFKKKNVELPTICDDTLSVKSSSRKSMDYEQEHHEDDSNTLSPINEHLNYEYILSNENVDFDTIPKNTNIYFDIGTKKQHYGTLIIKLYDDICPITCNNFRKLSVKSPITDDNQPAYTGCNFFRIVKKFMIQSGDFENNDGTGGVSIYGKHFDDENLSISLDKEGLLVSANNGSNTNGSQFFITTAPAQHLDGKHVVFGEIISGMNIIKTIEDMNVDDKYYPSTEIYITKSGILLPTY
jgi:peptidylprolyl isomerase